MKRVFSVLILMMVWSGVVYSQADSPLAEVGTPSAENIGTDSAQQRLSDVTITKFEDPGFWQSTIASDEGFMTLRRRVGSPNDKVALDKERLEAESAIGDPPGNYSLGVKVQFYKRALTDFYISPVRPIPIPGKSKTISFWAIGRNFNHRIKLIIEDYFGERKELNIGKLNFIGWKKLTVAVPPTIIQSDYHYTAKMGIKFLGFKVECDLLETMGTFYIYFDDLSAVTDLFEEESRDPDDIPDDW